MDHEKVYNEALEVVKGGVVKIDHFENIYRLPLKFEGVPNWRQATGFNVFGSGQPSFSGLLSVIKFYKHEKYLKNIIWVNMRSEPVLYANNMSFAPRNPSNLNENISVEGLSVSDVEMLQEFLIEDQRQRTREANNIFTYHKDTYALVPEDRRDIVLQEKCDDPYKNINTVNYTFSLAQNENEFEVMFSRLPVNDERVPNLEDFDRLSSLLYSNLGPLTAVHFNCQMGKGRTTTGMVLACLIQSKMLKKPIKYKEEENQDGTLLHGNYQAIVKLLKLLPDGRTMKMEMDAIIDACSHMQNLRTCIWETHENYCKEVEKDGTSSSRAAFWKMLGVNFIERYFYLICFNAFVTESSQTAFRDTFVYWCERNQAILDILGTRKSGYLSSFNWV